MQSDDTPAWNTRMLGDNAHNVEASQVAARLITEKNTVEYSMWKVMCLS